MMELLFTIFALGSLAEAGKSSSTSNNLLNSQAMHPELMRERDDELTASAPTSRSALRIRNTR